MLKPVGSISREEYEKHKARWQQRQDADMDALRRAWNAAVLDAYLHLPDYFPLASQAIN